MNDSYGWHRGGADGVVDVADGPITCFAIDYSLNTAYSLLSSVTEPMNVTIGMLYNSFERTICVMVSGTAPVDADYTLWQ